MIIKTFNLKGMTCESCVQKITEALMNATDVLDVLVSLEKSTVTISSTKNLNILDLRKTLSFSTKYLIEEISTHNIVENTNSKIITYKPLIILFFYILGVSTLNQIKNETFNINEWMNHFMAGFFLTFSFFKIINIKSFAESFSSYDLIANKWFRYGIIYPFIELLLGLSYFLQRGFFIANMITVILLTITTVGIIKTLRRKGNIKCACLGAGFNLPLSYVTVFENGIMIFMALFYFFK